MEDKKKANVLRKRYIKAVSTKTKGEGEEAKTTTSVRISVPKEGGGYEDKWPMVTASTKNAELIVKGATLNLYLSEDYKFINAAYTWEPKEAGEGEGDPSFDYGAGAESYEGAPF